MRGKMGRVDGHVYEDGVKRALYYLEWCENESLRNAYRTVSVGEWETDNDAAHRFSATMEVRSAGIGLMDQPLIEHPLLVNFMTSEEIRSLAGADELWHLIDHIIADDARVATVHAWINEELASAWDRLTAIYGATVIPSQTVYPQPEPTNWRALTAYAGATALLAAIAGAVVSNSNDLGIAMIDKQAWIPVLVGAVLMVRRYATQNWLGWVYPLLSLVAYGGIFALVSTS